MARRHIKPHDRFDRLEALEPIEPAKHGGSVLWRCVCRCGRETDAKARDLLAGEVRSCGCLKKEADQLRFRRMRIDRILRQIAELPQEDIEEIRAVLAAR